MNRSLGPVRQSPPFDPIGRYSVYVIGQIHGCKVTTTMNGGRIRLVASVDRRGFMDLDLQHWPAARGTAGVRYLELSATAPATRDHRHGPLTINELCALVTTLNRAVDVGPLEQVVVTMADPRAASAVKYHGFTLISQITDLALCLISSGQSSPVGTGQMIGWPQEVLRFTALARGRAHLT